MDDENRNWTDVPDDELEDACWDENPGAIEEHYTREIRVLRRELSDVTAERDMIVRARDAAFADGRAMLASKQEVIDRLSAELDRLLRKPVAEVVADLQRLVLELVEENGLFRRTSGRWKKLAKKYRVNQVDICPNCGRECDPTTCWCGDDHRKSYGDGGHSHIPMGCACGYAEDVARDEHVLKKMLVLARVERDKYKAELETLKRNLGIDQCDKIFCSDPNCNTNNPRT